MRLPVFPNWYPYNDMLLDGRLDIGERSVKTRSYNWDYRGPVLLYNSGRVAWHCVNAYGLPRDPASRQHHFIIGAAYLTEVRELTSRELRQMQRNFNNLSPRERRDQPWRVMVNPLPYGYFFESPTRFKESVPFRWPSGPIKPIFTEVTRNTRLYEELLNAGVTLRRSA